MATMGFKTSVPKQNQKIQNNLVPLDFRHAHAIGQTGCGKTTSFIYPNLEDRIKRGHSVLLYDFKGKEHMALKYFAHKHGRLNDVLEIGKPWGAKINLLRMFDRAGLESFIVKTLSHSKDNGYWGKMATAIALSIYDLIGALETFLNLSTKDGLTPDPLVKALKKYPYETTLSFTTLYSICKSSKSLMNYVDEVKCLQTSFIECLNEVLTRSKKASGSASIALMYSFNVFLDSVKALKVTLDEFTSSKQLKQVSTTFQSIVLSIAPLSQVASYEALNEDDVDIEDSLNKSSLISIDAQTLGESALTSINVALFSQFTKRKMLMQTQPISIFIDEAQKVLSQSDEIPIDVFRECKVELILSYQNEELMVKCLGDVAYDALRKNLSHTVLYTNPDSNDVLTSELNVFEFYSSEDNFRELEIAKSTFIEEKELYKTEYIYQRHTLRLDNDYVFDELHMDEVLVYNSKLYTKNRILLVNKYSLQAKNVTFMLHTDYDKAIKTVEHFLSHTKSDVLEMLNEF